MSASLLTGVLRVLRGQWAWDVIRGGGRAAVVLVLTMGLSQVLFVAAVMNTTFANVVVILTATPLFAAVFSGVFLGEWVPPRTWLAMALCMAGIALVFGGSIDAGNWFGDVLALGAALVVGANFTVLRRTPKINRLAVIAGGGCVAALAALPLAAPAATGGVSLAVLAVKNPKCHVETEVGKLIATLHGETKTEQVRSLASLSAEEIARLETLRGDLARDPAKTAQHLHGLKKRLEAYRAELTALHTRIAAGSMREAGIEVCCVVGGMRQSMSGAGNCYDNALMESCIGTIKTELELSEFADGTEALRELSEYVHYYNMERRHSSLGYVSPAAFEAEQARRK